MLNFGYIGHMYHCIFRVKYGNFMCTVPASMTLLLGDTAAVSSKLCGWKAACSSITNAAKAGLSEAGPFSQST